MSPPVDVSIIRKGSITSVLVLNDPGHFTRFSFLTQSHCFCVIDLILVK